MTELPAEAPARLLRSRGPDKKREFTAAELLGEFQALSRLPFIEVLSELMEGIPTVENIRIFANAHPDRWANCIKTMANLAGYHDKLEVQGNLGLDVNKLGDAQLMAKLEELGAQIKSMGIRTGLQDAEFEELETKEGDAPSE